MADKTGKKIVSPEVEIVLRSGGIEQVVIAYFADGQGGFDVLVGVADFDLRDAWASALRNSADALENAVSLTVVTDEDGQVP